MRIFLLFFALLALPVLSAGAVALANLERQLQAVAERPGFRIGVAVKDLTTGEELLLRGDESFRQASSIKIHVLTELYRQASAGRLDLHRPVTVPPRARASGSGLLKHLGTESVSMSLRDYAVLMIVLSDNTATNLLIDEVGIDAVNASMVAQGTPSIRLQRRMMDRAAVARGHDNVATPRDVMRSLELLHQGEVVDRRTSEEILAVLKIPRFGRPPLREPLPSTVPVAHKGGALATGIRCDSGIIYLPGGPYVLCVMTEGPAGDASGEAIITEVSRLVYQHFATVR